MLRKEDGIVIQALIRQGVYLCDIVRQLGVPPKTVRRALARGRAPEGRRGRRRSQLDPYRADIDRLLTASVWNAVVIFRKVLAKGYAGQLSILRDSIRPKRARRPGRATVRFETAPGHQHQSDWAVIQTEIAGRSTTVAFIVNTLGYARRFHFWCSDSTDAEHTYEGLIRAFEWFGGVPRAVLVDNQKAAGLEHPRGGLVQFHPRFIDLAGHSGFVPQACRPARAQTKGKDERMVGYSKHHCFVRYRQFERWAHLNQLAEQWLREEADQRRHGTVPQIVAERFAAEAPLLQPLPPRRYDTSYWELRQVSWDASIEVRGNRYSVPAALAGRRVSVRLSLDGVVTVFDRETCVARHTVVPTTAGWVTVPEHHAALWASTRDVEHRPLSVYEEVRTWSERTCSNASRWTICSRTSTGAVSRQPKAISTIKGFSPAPWTRNGVAASSAGLKVG